VLDEYGLMRPKVFSEVIRPTLSDRQGWALFMGTPNGKNQFYDIAQQAQREPDWFFAEYKASARRAF
jgi:phage terminase large subunit